MDGQSYVVHLRAQIDCLHTSIIKSNVTQDTCCIEQFGDSPLSTMLQPKYFGFTNIMLHVVQLFIYHCIFHFICLSWSIVNVMDLSQNAREYLGYKREYSSARMKILRLTCTKQLSTPYVKGGKTTEKIIMEFNFSVVLLFSRVNKKPLFKYT